MEGRFLFAGRFTIACRDRGSSPDVWPLQAECVRVGCDGG